MATITIISGYGLKKTAPDFQVDSYEKYCTFKGQYSQIRKKLHSIQSWGQGWVIKSI